MKFRIKGKKFDTKDKDLNKKLKTVGKVKK